MGVLIYIKKKERDYSRSYSCRHINKALMFMNDERHGFNQVWNRNASRSVGYLFFAYMLYRVAFFSAIGLIYAVSCG